MTFAADSMMEFGSRRLIFRPLTTNDVRNHYVVWMNDPEINQYLETRFHDQTMETCLSFVQKMNEDSTQNLFGIFEMTSLTHIGNIKLGFINRHHQTAQLSLVIGDKSFWGKGFATEAIARVSTWGFQHLGLRRIEAGCYDNNLGSLRAFLKAGFSVEGYRRKNIVFKDGVIGGFWMSLLRDEYKQE